MERKLPVVTCDRCQPCDNTPDLGWPIGVFFGTTEDALEAGWVEMEYGVICPACANEEWAAQQDDISGQVVSGALSGGVFSDLGTSLKEVDMDTEGIRKDDRSE